MGDFRKLCVWGESKELAILIYKITREGAFSKDYRFRDQIRSAAISISSNIAEGDELDTNLHSIRHFHIAKGSALCIGCWVLGIGYWVFGVGVGGQN